MYNMENIWTNRQNNIKKKTFSRYISSYKYKNENFSLIFKNILYRHTCNFLPSIETSDRF